MKGNRAPVSWVCLTPKSRYLSQNSQMRDQMNSQTPDRKSAHMPVSVFASISASMLIFKFNRSHE
jgi:hypothetical protein